MPKPLYVQKIIEKRRREKLDRQAALGVKNKEFFSTRCRWASDEQVSKFLDVSSQTLKEWRETSGMPFLKIKLKNRKGADYYVIRYDLNELEMWLQRRATTQRDQASSDAYENLMNKEANEANPPLATKKEEE